MSECPQCPHIVGDYTERDCGFPDCMGGWEEAYKNLSQQHQWRTEGHPPLDRTKPAEGIYWRESKVVPVMFHGNREEDVQLGFGLYREFKTHEEWHVVGTVGNWTVTAWYNLPEFKS